MTAQRYERAGKIYGLLTKCEVKIVRYWPRSFFGVFMGRDEVEVHKLAKNRTRPVSSHLDRARLVNKGFIIWLSMRNISKDQNSVQNDNHTMSQVSCRPSSQELF